MDKQKEEEMKKREEEMKMQEEQEKEEKELQKMRAEKMMRQIEEQEEREARIMKEIENIDFENFGTDPNEPKVEWRELKTVYEFDGFPQGEELEREMKRQDE